MNNQKCKTCGGEKDDGYVTESHFFEGDCIRELKRQLAHFLKTAGAEIRDGELVFSSAGYGAWTKRKGDQRTREIYTENGHLQGQILGLQSLIKDKNEIMIMALGRERAEDVNQIAELKAGVEKSEAAAAEFATYIFNKLETVDDTPWRWCFTDLDFEVARYLEAQGKVQVHPADNRWFRWAVKANIDEAASKQQ